MAKLNSIAVNGTVYELPSMTQFSSQIQALGSAMSSAGVSAYEMTEAIRKMSDVLARLNVLENRMDHAECETYEAKRDAERVAEALDGRTAALEVELNDLRSAMDVKTENPNQKGDLEISSQIEVNPFLPNFVDLDSEDFLQQRPLWDFTVDF